MEQLSEKIKRKITISCIVIDIGMNLVWQYVCIGTTSGVRGIYYRNKDMYWYESQSRNGYQGYQLRAAT